MQLYLYDSSDYTDDLVNRQGRLSTTISTSIGPKTAAYPFLICLEDRLSVWCSCERWKSGADPFYQLAEFFILLTHRRLGIGKLAATMLFDDFPGRWEVQQA